MLKVERASKAKLRNRHAQVTRFGVGVHAYPRLGMAVASEEVALLFLEAPALLTSPPRGAAFRCPISIPVIPRLQGSVPATQNAPVRVFPGFSFRRRIPHAV